MFLYTSGSTGLPKGVVLSHQSHIWVVETRLAPDLDRHRYLIAAPLYHMNALALSKLACAAHATVVLLPRFEAKSYIEAIGHYRPTWLTAVPPMIAMMLRERETMEKTDLSSVEFIRMGSAPVSEALMAATHKAFPKARVTNAYGTTEAGPVVFGPHPKGLPQPEDSVGYPHPEGAVASGRWREPRCRSGRAGNEMPGADERLSQPAGREAAVHRRRLLHHRRRVPPRRQRLSLFPRPHRRHVRLGRREHLSGRRRAHAGDSIPTSARRWSSRSTTTSRAPSRSPSSSRRRATSPPRTRSRNMRWRTRRPTSTRASSGSSTNCRSRPPTRWIARRCRKLAQERVAAAAAS